MIFVTVGTHEQPFNRLIQEIDNLKSDGTLVEEVVIQTGFSTYRPKYCKWSTLFSYKDMQKNIARARIIITHGGPSSFIAPLQMGKIPIVIPRKQVYKEHINNHQISFCKAVEKRDQNIILVENIEDLKETIERYDELIKTKKDTLCSNNDKFCSKFNKLVDDMMKHKKCIPQKI